MLPVHPVPFGPVGEDSTHPRIQKLRERKERHKQRSKPYRLGFGVVGGVLVLGGLVLSLPLVPGPGFLLVFVGLAMLALEFDRVERLVERLVHRVDRIEEGARQASPLQKALGAGATVAAVAAFVAAALLWDLPLLPF
jgi:uncharacterized protein (TIGR02611 family)